ncbi:MAG: hypothetical protein M5U08_24400 [Burkholderiales bacterium]|nr:hypothetical protein [Burkholderiales bacterium]
MTLRRCIQCRSETEVTAIDAAAGEAETLAIALKEMPVAACARGHRQFVHAEFPRQLVEHLLDEDEAKLPAGEEKGLLRKHYHCTGTPSRWMSRSRSSPRSVSSSRCRCTGVRAARRSSCIR